MTRRSFLVVLLAALVCASSVRAARPILSIGVVADIQYADKETKRRRRYRSALPKLEKCVADWMDDHLDFVVQLGDSIDGNKDKSVAEHQQMVKLLESAGHKLYHVIGNHDRSEGGKLLAAQGHKDGWYSFVLKQWRFVVLYGQDISKNSGRAGDPRRKLAKQMRADNPKLKSFDGALSDKQIAWLESELKLAEKKRESVIVFAHHPLHAKTTKDGTHALWNADKVSALLKSYPCVKATFSGHYHRGGYVLDEGLHFVTIEALLSAPDDENGYATVEVHKTHLEIVGTGSVTSRKLKLRPDGNHLGPR